MASQPSQKALGKRKLIEADAPSAASSESGEVDFLRIVDGDDSESDEDDSLDDEELQQEMLDEMQLERELQEEEEEEADSDSSLSLDGLLSKHTQKPPEDFDGDASNLYDWLDYDARDYKDRRRTVQSKITGKDKFEWDEIQPGYDSGSEVGDAENRVGNIPAYFYDDMPHVGYDIDGKRVLKPAKGDELDKFLATVDGTAWTSVEDKTSGQNVELTDAELDLIQRLAKSENPDATYDRRFFSIENCSLDAF